MRRALVAGFLLVGAIVVGLVLSEAAYRVTRRFVCIGGPDLTLWTPHAEYGWTHQPNASGWNHACVGRRFEWEAFTAINANGLRDYDYPYERRRGVARVLLLGDSVTEGMQVPLERTFAKLLEGGLRRGGRQVEVINAGVAGYSTDNELLFFRGEGRRYHPDLVLLMFNTENDVMESSKELHARMYAGSDDSVLHKTYFELSPTGELVRNDDAIRNVGTTRPPNAVLLWLMRNFFLVRASLRALAPHPHPHVGIPPTYPTNLEIYRKPPPPEWLRAWRISAALIGELRDEVEAAGARFAVAVVPGKESVLGHWGGFPMPNPGAWDFDQPARLATQYLASSHIACLDLLPFLRWFLARSGHTGYFAVFDVHLNADGHALVANALRPFVEKQLDTASAPGGPPGSDAGDGSDQRRNLVR